MAAVPLARVPRFGAARARVLAAVATVAGSVTGRALRVAPTVPGLAGAAAVSVCTGEVASHVFGHGLAPWIGGLLGGLFLLVIDKRIP